MITAKRQTALARLLMVGGLVTGLIGLIAGLTDQTWRLGTFTWFTGGILLAILAVAVLVDAYVQLRQKER